MMTLEEAIQHCEDTMYKQKELGCNLCAQDHEQLKQWLEELRRYREAEDNQTWNDNCITNNNFTLYDAYGERALVCNASRYTDGVVLTFSIQDAIIDEEDVSSVWSRIKRAFKALFGKPYTYAEVVVENMFDAQQFISDVETEMR